MNIVFSLAHLRDIDPVTLYGILKLRTDTFVVEQECPYPELDGRDLESGCLQLWGVASGASASEPAGPVATLRILDDGDALRIGRVVVHPSVRGTGVARELFARGVAECERIDATRPILLDAQEPLESWYASFGFARAGDTFLEDGIPHVLMRREPHSTRA